MSNKQQTAASKRQIKEKEKAAALLKQQEEEEQKVIQEQKDIKDFQTAPRIRLNLKKAFGINDNLTVNQTKSGTSIEFLKTPQSEKSQESQLLTIVGRQLAIRDLQNNNVSMLPNENFSNQVTAVTSHCSSDRSLIAMAEQDYYDSSKLFFSIFEVSGSNDDGHDTRVLVPRVKIDLPEDEQSQSPHDAAEVEESKGGGRRCEFPHGHKKPHQEFTSAAAAQASQVKSGDENRANQSQKPFVSQICFSNDQYYVACLISGPINRVMIYEWKSGKKQPVINHEFEVFSTDTETISPNGGDQSHITTQSKISMEKIYTQTVTQISFNPRHKLSLVLTGPNGKLEYTKIDTAKKTLEPQFDPHFEDMKRSIMELGDNNITCHSWSEDADYFGLCTDLGQLFVYNVLNDIVLEEQFEDFRFVSISLFELGFVATTFDGRMIFYELDREANVYTAIRQWHYKHEASSKQTMDDVIRGVRVLDSEKTKKMAVQLSNRRVLLVDLFHEVYSQEKRDDIEMKLKEHANIMESPEERARLSQMALVDKNKAKEAREKEQEQVTAIGYKLVGNGFHSGSISEMHTCLQRPVLLTLSKEDESIRVWNYSDNTCNLYQTFQQDLVSCALHPSGYYMAVALDEQIRLYHLLHPEIKQFNSYELKNIKKIRFSSGGQYFCAVDHKNIYIFHTYTMKQVRNLVIPPNPMNSISFSFDDSRIVFISADGILQNFDLNDFSRVGENRIDRTYSYKSALFLSHDDPDDSQVITVGTQKDIGASIRIFEGDEMKMCLKFADDQPFDQPALCFNDIVKVVSAENLVQNLVVGTNRGSLVIRGLPPRFLREDPFFEYETVVSHFGEVTALQASVDGRYVFSAGADGIIFVYEVSEYTPPSTKNHSRSQVTANGQSSVIDSGYGSMQHSVMDRKRESNGESVEPTQRSPTPGHNASNSVAVSKIGIDIQDELARIVLVGKSLMEDWRKMQETLRTEMERQQDIVDRSLRDENFRFIQRNNAMEKAKTEELNKLNRKYEILQMEEAEQKDDNQQSMNKLEINHNQCKEELQDLYEKKWDYEMEQLRKLKEAQNDMKKYFENDIKRLNDMHDSHVEKLLDDFKVRLQYVQGTYEDSKKVADDLKMKNEEKLTSQEQDQLHEITELTKENEEVISGYDKAISQLKTKIEQQRCHKNKIQSDIEEMMNKTKTISNVTINLTKQGKEYEKQIKELDQDKKEATLNLKKKEDELFQQKFKIKDLQKTKQVLTHRTFEMKASLEPKEQQIESLKQNLHDLEKLFDMQAKSLQQMDKNVKDKEDARDRLEKQMKRARRVTKRNEHAIQDFVQDIQNTMQKQDDADKIQGLMHIYKAHVKEQSEEVFTKKQKDPEMIDELDKHLKYMEKQIRQLQENSSKNLKKAKDHIESRTDENKKFIKDLTELRDRDKIRKEKQYKVDKKITEIKLAQRRIDTEVQKMKEDMQKVRLLDGHKPGMTRTSSVYMRKDETNKETDQFRRSMSKGKLIKGSQWRNRPSGMLKARVTELSDGLDRANKTIMVQQLQLDTLRNEYMQVSNGGLLTFEGMDSQQYQGELQKAHIQQLQAEIENFSMLTQAQQNQYIQQIDAQQRAQEGVNHMTGEDDDGANHHDLNGQQIQM